MELSLPRAGGVAEGEETGQMEIGQVIEMYKGTVYGIALTRAKNRHDADDIFQDVFLAYVRRQPRFNDEEHRKAWLIKVTVNCANKFLKKNRCDTAEYAEALSGRPISFESEEDTAIYAALCGLPEKYRVVLHLHYYLDQPAEQIGRALGLRPGTVRVRMLRGREMLKERLKGELL
jgi:RNA polymerase sigma-70 factor (ECF subfamily)